MDIRSKENSVFMILSLASITKVVQLYSLVAQVKMYSLLFCNSLTSVRKKDD
jgi:hypothetical protein